MSKSRTCLFVLPFLFVAAARADVSVPAIFGDNMVLQRETPVNIWGQAAPGEAITLTVNNQSVRTVAGADGQWKAKLPPQKAGGPFDLTLAGNNTLVLKNVSFGDVWLLSGQSNMEWGSKGILKPEVFAEENPKANDPELRLFIVKKNPQAAPVRDLSGQWQPTTPDSMANFSATGYFFGRELRRKLGVPIGLIGSYWGGTPSEAFTSQGSLEKDANYPALKTLWDQRTADYLAKQKRYEEEILPKWRAEVDKAKAAGQPEPRRPGGPWGAPLDTQRPSLLYNGMISPLIPLSLKGIAWYQGESNGDDLTEAVAYKSFFPTLIQDWRTQWGEQVPFLFIQLAAYRNLQEQPVEPKQAWPYVREAQMEALKLPDTGMVIAIDNADPETIHPKDKITIGDRLAAVALGTVYGQRVPYTGPLFDKASIQGNTVRVTFTHADDGLKARGETLKGFAIAGEDGQFVWADARINGNSVILSNPQVLKPIAVRYGWADNPIGNLTSGAGLPASPFRTDTNVQPVFKP